MSNNVEIWCGNTETRATCMQLCCNDSKFSAVRAAPGPIIFVQGSFAVLLSLAWPL
jgi:hypothetical protein